MVTAIIDGKRQTLKGARLTEWQNQKQETVAEFRERILSRARSKVLSDIVEARLVQFKADAQAIATDAGLTPAQKKAQIEALLDAL